MDDNTEVETTEREYVDSAPQYVKDFVTNHSLKWTKQHFLTRCPAWGNVFFSLQCEEVSSSYESLSQLQARYEMAATMFQTDLILKANNYKWK